MRKKKEHNKIYGFIFAVIIAVVSYAFVSTAAKHDAIDRQNLIQWRYEHAVRP